MLSLHGQYKLILNTYLFTYSLRLNYHHLQILRTNAYNNDSFAHSIRLCKTIYCGTLGEFCSL